MNKNTLNLQGGAFFSADESITIEPLLSPLAFTLMNATGSKIVDRQLKVDSSGKYHMVMLTDSSNQTVWAMIPVDYPCKWSDNKCWVLLKPEASTMSEDDYNNLPA